MKDDTRKTAKDAQTEKAKKAFACQLKSARERTGKTQSQFFQLIHKGKTPGDDILTHDAFPLCRNCAGWPTTAMFPQTSCWECMMPSFFAG